MSERKIISKFIKQLPSDCGREKHLITYISSVQGIEETYYYNGYRSGSGLGTLYHFDTNGNKKILYYGNWENHLMDGFGIAYFKNEKLKYVGDWKRGKFYGFGVSFYKNYRKNDIYGSGLWENAMHYSGLWENGKFHKQGILYDTNSTIIYDGGWNCGLAHNYGTALTPIISSQYCLAHTGRWENGKRQGEGILVKRYYTTGEIQIVRSGVWENGEFQSPESPPTKKTKIN